MGKFSRIEYQEELIKKNIFIGKKSAHMQTDTDLSPLFSNQEWLIFDFANVKHKIPFKDILLVSNITNHTIIPAIHPHVFGITNINNKDVVMVDVEAWHKKNISSLFSEKLPKNYLIIVLKKENIGMCCKAYPSEGNENLEQYPIFNTNSFIQSITKKSDGAHK